MTMPPLDDPLRNTPDNPLDNAVWHALGTAHRHLGEDAGGARRYRGDVSPFYAVDTVDDRAWTMLAELAGAASVVVLFRDTVPPPPVGWVRLGGGCAHQMVAARLIPPPVQFPSRPLNDNDVPEMLALVELAQPGPFLPRTIECGGYVGVFDDRRLVAMAGERMAVGGFTEVSAVCTHPDRRGGGLAAALTFQVASAIVGRGDTPMLHVAAGNDGARHVYERLGFRTRRMIEFVALRTPGGEGHG